MLVHMDFSAAIAVAQYGQPVARRPWVADRRYVVWQRGYPEGIPINANTAQATGLPEGAVVRFRPYLMEMDQEGWLGPYTPSQGDLGADDWVAYRANIDRSSRSGDKQRGT